MSPPNPPSEPVQTDEAHRLQFNLDALSEIGSIFISETDFQKTSVTALRVIMGAVATSRGALLTYDETARCLQGTVARGIPTHQINIQVSEVLKNFLIKVQAPIVLNEKDAWPAPLKACESDIRALGFRIWVPLVIRNTLLGVLSLGEKFLEEPYTPDDLRLLWTLRTHFCVGLYNQYLIAESRQVNFQLNHKVVELETLYNAGLTLASSLQVEEVVEEILLLSVSIVDAQSGFLFVKNERTNRFPLDHHIGLNEHQCELLKSGPQVRRVLGRVLRSNKVHHLGPEDMPTELVDIQYALIAPVGDLGLLVVCDKESREGIHPFTESDAQLLELIGQQAGASLANARLYKSILEVKTYNQNILSSIANGVISTDLQGRIVQFNPSVERVFEAQSIPLGKSCVRFFKQNGCDTLADAIRNTLKDGQPRQIAGEHVQSSGVTLNARLAALRNEQEEIQGVVIALEDLSEEMRLRSMFKQYASDQVVDLLLTQKDAPSLSGTKCEVTILFVDIVGSTTLLGRIGAEKMAALLNSYFSCLIEVIFQYNGTLDKYTGDGFMVVYGAPVAFPDDTERAVRTALAMQEGVHSEKSFCGKY